MKIILIPGSGAGGNVWRYQERGLPDCEGVSLPGHPQGQACTTVADYVAWLHGYIHEKGYRDVILGGHSLGSAVAQLYALTYPGELKGLVLIGAGARLRVRPDILEAVKGMIDQPEKWRRYIEATPLPSADPVLQEIRETRVKIGPAVLLSDFLCCDRFDIMERVGEIRLPTLIIVGTEDVMTPPKYAQFLASKIAGSKLVIIEGATHSIATEKPEEVNKVVREWVGGASVKKGGLV